MKLGMHSLRTKIIIVLVGVTGLIVAVYQAYLYYSLKTQLVNELNTSADNKISLLQRDLQLPMWELDQEWIGRIADTQMSDREVVSIVITGEGGIDVSKVKSNISNEFDTFTKMKPILYNGKTIGKLLIRFSTERIEKRLESQRNGALIMASLIVMLISGILVLFFNILILRPIRLLQDATENIGLGRYEEKLILPFTDEIGMLGKGIEAMKLQIQTREIKIQQSFDELDHFFSVSLDLLCIADTGGKFLRLNMAWESVLGYPLEELYRHQFLDFVHPDDLSATLSAVEQLAAQKKVMGFVNRYRNADGSYRWLEWRSVPHGDLIYAAAHDITEAIHQRKALENMNETLEGRVAERTEELIRANTKLKELDKLKSMFIASMSHELRTPLNSIIGFSGVLLQGLTGSLNEKQVDFIRRISSAGKHLLSLISDVIDISKIEAGRIQAQIEPFSLNEMLQEAVNEMEIVAAQKGLVLRIESGGEIAMQTDRRRLYQCLLNYLSNAVKFTEKSGIIIISVEEKGDQVSLSVVDEGIGIDESDQPKLFEAFERLETHLRVKAGGTGLGLYLTRKITETVLRGSIWMRSQKGVGSTFGLTIPKKITTIGK